MGWGSSVTLYFYAINGKPGAQRKKKGTRLGHEGASETDPKKRS
jgi:hypothetical protein